MPRIIRASPRLKMPIYKYSGGGGEVDAEGGVEDTKKDIRKVLTELQERGIFLSSYGNQAAKSSSQNKEEDLEIRMDSLNFEMIDYVMDRLDNVFKEEHVITIPTGDSYEMNQQMQQLLQKSDGIKMTFNDGDFIMVMILAGYKCCFHSADGNQRVYPYFNASPSDDNMLKKTKAYNRYIGNMVKRTGMKRSYNA